MEKEGKCLVKRHAFGARADVKGSLGWLDEGTLMYPVGKAVALHTISTNNQRFLEASYQSTGITALAVSANKKFIAVAEGGDNPQIQVIDTTTRKRRKVLTVPDLGSDRFTAMAFSADGRHLVTQGGAPSWKLFYWNWERSKPLASVCVAATVEEQADATAAPGTSGGPANSSINPSSSAATSTNNHSVTSANSPHGPFVTNVAICPGDALTMTVSGVGLLRFYKYTDGFLQPQPSCGYPRERQEIIATHAWIDGERLVASTKRSGGLFLVERGRYVGQIDVDKRMSNIKNYSSADSPGGAGAMENSFVTAIVATRNGFTISTSTGAVSVYEKNAMAVPSAPLRLADEDDNEDGMMNLMYERLCTLQVPEHEPGEPVNPLHAQGGNKTVSKSNDGSRTTIANGQPAERSCGLGAGVSGTLSATATHSGKPRRFHVAPSTANQNLLDGTAGHGGAEDGVDYTAEGSAVSPGPGHRPPTGPPSAPAATAAAAASSAQEAAGVLLGTSSTQRGHGVAAMALDQGEESLAVLTNAGKIYALDFRQHWAHIQREIDNSTGVREAGPSGAGVGEGSVSATGDTANPTAAAAASVALSNIPVFEPICEPFHSGRINGMSCSVRKPFLLTSSSDHSVRLWNTFTHKMEMCVFFKEEPGAVAIHPSGLMAVICFPDCVRVMNVLWNSLRDRRVINFRHASDVTFSHGGQFFAVTHGNLVDLFRSATCEPHGQLRGHPQKVKDLKWCSTSPYPTDNSLITCSMDGMIMYWGSQDARKEVEHSDNKRYQYLAIAADDRYVWALGAPTSTMALEVQWKVTLREMDRHVLGSPNASSEDYEFTDTALTSLLVASHQRMLFGGGEDGSLKVMTLPLPVGVQEAPLPAHAARITRMAVSHDESTLFTAGADGSIFLWEIREDGNRAAGVAATAATSSALVVGGGRLGAEGFQYGTNEVLVTQQELEEQRVEMESLQQTIEKLKTDIDSEEKRRNHEQGTRLRERMEEFKGDAAALASEHAAVWNSKAEQERAFVAIKLEKEAEAAHEMERTESTHQAEVQALEELCNDLQYTLEQEQSQHVRDLDALRERLSQEDSAERARYQDMVAQRKEVLEKLTRQVARARQTNEEALHQLELDTDAESQEVCGKHQRELNVLRERFLHMKGEGAIMRKNAVRMEREIDVRSGELRLLDSAKTALTGQLSELSQRMAQLHQDIDERDAVIGEKEKTIYALKKQNQELEKYKFVLDHRIRQLKAQMEPKQREIMQHNQQIKLRNSELESLHENNLTLRANIDSLKADLAEQQQLTKQLLKAIKDFDTYKARYLRDVGEIAPALQEPARLREVVDRLHSTHVVSRGGQRVAAADPQIKQEFQEQLEYLSTSVGALRRKVRADQEHHRREVSAMMTENLTLIKEIHALRTEIQNLRTMVAADEAVRRAQGSLSATAPSGGGARGSNRSRRGHQKRFASSVTIATAAGEEDDEVDEGKIQDVFNATGPAAPAGGSPSPSTGTTAADGGMKTGKAKVNPMPSSSAPHPHPPTSTRGTRAASSVGGASTRRHGGGDNSGRSGRDSRAPEPPKIIEENRTELRMLRAYVELLERTLAESQRPSSTLAGGQRLPPISPVTANEAKEQ